MDSTTSAHTDPVTRAADMAIAARAALNAANEWLAAALEPHQDALDAAAGRHVPLHGIEGIAQTVDLSVHRDAHHHLQLVATSTLHAMGHNEGTTRHIMRVDLTETIGAA